MSTLNVSNITDGTDTVGTSYVVNGSAKAWANLNGGTFGLRNSLNISSAVDTATGLYEFNFASSFSSRNYSSVASCDSNAGTYGHILAIDNNTDPTASLVRVVNRTSNGGNFFTSDRGNCNITLNGDLA